MVTELAIGANVANVCMFGLTSLLLLRAPCFTAMLVGIRNLAYVLVRFSVYDTSNYIMFGVLLLRNSDHNTVLQFLSIFKW